MFFKQNEQYSFSLIMKDQWKGYHEEGMGSESAHAEDPF